MTRRFTAQCFTARQLAVRAFALTLCTTALLLAGCSEWRNAEPRHPASDGSAKSGSNNWQVEGGSSSTQPQR